MTWQEFKDLIDKKLAEAGGGEETPIWYIDVSFLDSGEEINVVIDKNCGTAVS